MVIIPKIASLSGLPLLLTVLASFGTLSSISCDYDIAIRLCGSMNISSIVPSSNVSTAATLLLANKVAGFC